MNKFSLKRFFKSERGMTLMEVLVALTILMIIIFTFTPLFASYYKNIRRSGEFTRKNYEKASLMERLLANNGYNPDDYETSVNGVPLTFSIGEQKLRFYSSSTDTGTYIGRDLGGKILTTDSSFAGEDNEYVSYYVGSLSNQMLCFPSSLTDDFLETEIKVIPRGFDFATKNGKLITKNFKLYYTDSNQFDASGNYKLFEIGENKYYKISELEETDENGNKKVVGAKITFYGGNDTICFQNSPIVIKYDNLYSVNVEIGAPKIIMVGEKASSGGTDNYYYYVTHGVEPETGRMDIIAKTMKSKTDNAANLNSAMNCVEWVEPGMGTNESGGVNDYGYYVMGGDNGQIRRFWRHGTAGKPGNYYWGGDTVWDYQLYQMGDSNGNVSAYSGNNITKKTNATSVSQKLIFSSYYDSADSKKYTGLVSIFNKESGAVFIKTGHYNMYAANFGTATANAAGAYKPKIYTQGTVIKDAEEARLQLIAGMHGIVTAPSALTDLTVPYSQMTGDTSSNPITITSVGSIPLISTNKSAYTTTAKKISQIKDLFNSDTSTIGFGVGYDGEVKMPVNISASDAFPTSTYTLYCGTIPAYLDLAHCYWFSSNIKGYVATLGVGALKDSAGHVTYGITGLFGDQNTQFKTDFGLEYTGTSLLNYIANSTEVGKEEWINNSSNLFTVTKNNLGVTGGSLLPNYRQDKGITSGKQVDITIGYLSYPFAKIMTPIPTRQDNSKKYLSSGKDHNFYASAPAEFSNFLDIVSFKLDVVTKDNSGTITVTPTAFSVAAGYGLGFFAADLRGAIRLNNVYNVGAIYLRGSGDGTEGGWVGRGDGSVGFTDNLTIFGYQTDSVADNIKPGRGWSLKLESNIFHSLYTIDSRAVGKYLALGYTNGTGVSLNNNKEVANSDIATDKKTISCYGWDEAKHKSNYLVMQNGDGSKTNNDPAMEYENTHIMMQTECKCVDFGLNPYGLPEFMVGTTNGSVLSWYYDDSIGRTLTYNHNAPSGAMKKEFESYTWSNGNPDSALGGNYDYWTQVETAGNASSVQNYSNKFVSSLVSVNDIKYGDDYWVAVGQQGNSDPLEAGSGSGACPLGRAGNEKAGSYINVRYTVNGNIDKLAWKAVKVSDEYITFLSVKYCEGIWYAMGFIDEDNDGIQDPNDEGVLYYAINPLETSYTSRVTNGSYNTATYNGGWRRVITRTATETNGEATYTADDTKVVLCNSNGTKTDFTLLGVNAMASQG